MNREKKITIIGNLLILALALYPLLLGIIISSGFLSEECPGSIVRPSYWLMTNGLVQTAFLIVATFSLFGYLVFGNKYIFWGHLVLLCLCFLWFVFWGLIGVLGIAFRSSECDKNPGNYVMSVWVGFSVAYNIFIIMIAALFGWNISLFTAYHEMANEYDTMPL